MDIKLGLPLQNIFKNNPQNNLDINLMTFQDYIVNNYGNKTWLEIESCIQKNLDEDKRNENY